MMAFKNKDQAMIAIQNAAINEAQYMSHALMGQPLNTAVAAMIGSAVRAGLEEAFRQMYSQEDLEHDLELK
jgi:hypothetical protein